MNKVSPESIDIEFLHKLVRELDIAKLFHIAAEGLAAQLGADGAALIVKEEPRQLRYQFFHGLPSAYKSLADHSFDDNLGVAGAVLHAHKPVLVTDYPNSPYALPEYIESGLQSSLCSPVVANGKVLAVLAISWFQTPAILPSVTDYRLLEIVSDLVGAALHRFNTELRLRDMAMHDPLTGAANRNLFFDRLNHAMAMTIRKERLMAVIIFDIDNFKMINDRFGHVVGDTLLIEVRLRVRDVIREGDTIARLGGDEFAVILTDLRCYTEIDAVVERIRQILRMRWGTPAMQVAVSISLGVTVYPLDEGDDQALLQNADTAMYAAKRLGGNKGLLFNHNMGQDSIHNNHLILEFGKAIEQGQMVLYFQPIVDIATGHATSAEALIRWQHPTHGLLAPPQFISAIEHSYNSLKLDAWVVSEALTVLASWQARGIFKKLHINLSAISVENHRFCDTLRRALAASPTPVDPSYLGIELVEWSTIQDIDAARSLIMDCRILGISVALDDFGTGYASLQHLRSLPIDTIKIDRSFISGLVDDPADRVLVRSMISAAEAFGIEVVAEGIETEQQKSILLSMGCAYGQGYLFAPPRTEDMLWVASPEA